MTGYPQRIVCLTEETTETLYLLGEGDRVVGVSGYTVRPPEARQKPKISSFLHAKHDKIDALAPDLILAFSDLQADITTALVKRGHPSSRSTSAASAEILQMVRSWVASSARRIGPKPWPAPREGARRHPHVGRAFSWRPRVYFEEWDDPLISGIRWVEELVEIAGGEPVFPELRTAALGKDRILTADRVIAAAPEVFIGSWCGKPVRKARVKARPGWDAVPFIVHDRIYEVKSPFILQPGPAALTEGVRQIHAVLCRAVGVERPEHLAPAERWDDGGPRPSDNL